jgi:hypothetical protein
MATKATPNLINTLNQNTTGSSGSCTGNAATATATVSQTGTGTIYVASVSPTLSSGLTISSGAAETFIYDNGNSGTSKAIAWNNGNNQKVSVTGAVAFTFTAPTNPGKFTIIIKQDATGHVYSLPTIKWANGVAPTLSTAANAIDILTILYDGTNYYGSFGGAFA